MYNKEEIGKNLNGFVRSLDEVFFKLSMFPDNAVLHERVEVTLALADFVKYSLSNFNDEYIYKVIQTIDSYLNKYEEMKTKMLKSDFSLVS